MENKIKDDLNRKILYQRLINDNTLLEYVLKNDKVLVCIRFVESPTSGIKEHVLKILEDDEIDTVNNSIVVNEDNSAIAIFKKGNNKYQLNGVYYTDEHAFIPCDFVDIAYKEKFSEKKLIK